MKAPGHTYQIRRTVNGTWDVTKGMTVLFNYKTYRMARNRHAALALNLPWKVAIRMGNP